MSSLSTCRLHERLIGAILVLCVMVRTPGSGDLSMNLPPPFVCGRRARRQWGSTQRTIACNTAR